jgi:hypothetical protein
LLRGLSGGVIRSQVQGLTLISPFTTEDAGSSDGRIGRLFFTQDRRADSTIQSVPNPANDSPAEFRQKSDLLLAFNTSE